MRAPVEPGFLEDDADILADETTAETGGIPASRVPLHDEFGQTLRGSSLDLDAAGIGQRRLECRHDATHRDYLLLGYTHDVVVE